jgi:hypothetical protein
MAAVAANTYGTDGECSVCYENAADMRLEPCGHRTLCSTCLQNMTANARRANRIARCPECRGPIQSSNECRLQIFNTIGSVFDVPVTLANGQSGYSAGSLVITNNEGIYLCLLYTFVYAV